MDWKKHRVVHSQCTVHREEAMEREGAEGERKERKRERERERGINLKCCTIVNNIIVVSYVATAEKIRRVNG